jgi:hypothetical protein
MFLSIRRLTMIEDADNKAVRDLTCVQCGHVGSPINVGPGPGWLALILWGAAALIWILGVLLQSLVVGYLAAPAFLGAFIYSLWYFYRREKACRECGAKWAARRASSGASGSEEKAS